jgi:hypothetical protein
MHWVREVLRAEKFTDRVESLVVDEDCAEQGLLRLNVGRRKAKAGAV